MVAHLLNLAESDKRRRGDRHDRRPIRSAHSEPDPRCRCLASVGGPTGPPCQGSSGLLERPIATAGATTSAACSCGPARD